MDFHTLIAASVGTAQPPEPKNSTGSPVILVISWLTMPSCGSSIHVHTSAVTTPEMRNGRIISPRTVVLTRQPVQHDRGDQRDADTEDHRQHHEVDRDAERVPEPGVVDQLLEVGEPGPLRRAEDVELGEAQVDARAASGRRRTRRTRASAGATSSHATHVSLRREAGPRRRRVGGGVVAAEPPMCSAAMPRTTWALESCTVATTTPPGLLRLPRSGCCRRRTRSRPGCRT